MLFPTLLPNPIPQRPTSRHSGPTCPPLPTAAHRCPPLPPALRRRPAPSGTGRSRRPGLPVASPRPSANLPLVVSSARPLYATSSAFSLAGVEAVWKSERFPAPPPAPYPRSSALPRAARGSSSGGGGMAEAPVTLPGVAGDSHSHAVILGGSLTPCNAPRREQLHATPLGAISPPCSNPGGIVSSLRNGSAELQLPGAPGLLVPMQYQSSPPGTANRSPPPSHHAVRPRP